MNAKADTKKRPRKTEKKPKTKATVEEPKVDGSSDSEAEIEAEAADQDLQSRLTAAEQKAEENWQQVLRSQAELENLRKRSQRDVENAHRFGLEKIATELLAVRDSMELGLGAVNGQANVDSLREGAELTLKLLTQVMEKFGIQEVDPTQQRFNPDLHQAMSMQETNEVEPNTVVTVMQKGYTLNERLLRPALVAVAKAPANG